MSSKEGTCRDEQQVACGRAEWLYCLNLTEHDVFVALQNKGEEKGKATGAESASSLTKTCCRPVEEPQQQRDYLAGTRQRGETRSTGERCRPAISRCTFPVPSCGPSMAHVPRVGKWRHVHWGQTWNSVHTVTLVSWGQVLEKTTSPSWRRELSPALEGSLRGETEAWRQTLKSADIQRLAWHRPGGKTN